MLTYLLLFLIGLDVGFTQNCQECVLIEPMGDPRDEELKGEYRFVPGECPEGCSYVKDNDQDDIWCFKPQSGPYDLNTCSSSSTVLSSTGAPAPAATRMMTLLFEEDGIIFEQEDSFNNVTGEAAISVPAHGENAALEVVMQESTGIMLSAGENTCQLATIPSDIDSNEMDTNGDNTKESTSDTTIKKEQESIKYALKVSMGEASEEEKASLTDSMKKACGNNIVEKVEDIVTDEDTFNKMANGEIMAIDSGDSRRKREAGSNTKRLCTSNEKSCWRWPYSDQFVSIHHLQLSTLCVTCIDGESTSLTSTSMSSSTSMSTSTSMSSSTYKPTLNYCQCSEITSFTKLSECYAISEGKCVLGTYKCESSGECLLYNQQCDGQCYGGNKKCGDECISLNHGKYYKRECITGGETECIRISEPCNGQCADGYLACGDRCLPDYYFTSYGYRECNGKCINSYTPCNGQCSSGYFLCGQNSCRNDRYRDRYYDCNGTCLYYTQPCDGVCPGNGSLCGAYRCLQPGTWSADNYRACGDRCIYKYDQCDGSCIDGLAPCGIYECVEDIADYLKCGGYCYYEDYWTRENLKACGGRCLWRNSWPYYHECDGKCISSSVPCGSTSIISTGPTTTPGPTMTPVPATSGPTTTPLQTMTSGLTTPVPTMPTGPSTTPGLTMAGPSTTPDPTTTPGPTTTPVPTTTPEPTTSPEPTASVPLTTPGPNSAGPKTTPEPSSTPVLLPTGTTITPGPTTTGPTTTPVPTATLGTTTKAPTSAPVLLSTGTTITLGPTTTGPTTKPGPTTKLGPTTTGPSTTGPTTTPGPTSSPVLLPTGTTITTGPTTTGSTTPSSLTSTPGMTNTQRTVNKKKYFFVKK